ncbi:MAG: radical SAM protein [Armatimonadetes bacterium]|nr:radical SAM protein [Armatimonadota bacterium]
MTTTVLPPSIAPSSIEERALLDPRNRDLLETLLREGPESVPAPVAITVDLTHACNNSCPDCIERQPMCASNHAALTLPTLDRLLSEAAQAGVRAIGLYGGEPTLHPHFPDVVRYATALQLYLFVVTNGYQLHKDEVALALEEASRLGFLDAVRVSWNSSTASTHSLLHRAERYFWRMVDACEQLSRRGVPVSVSFLVEPANICEIVPAACLAGAIGVHGFALRPKTRAHGEHLISLSPEQREGILNAIETVRELAYVNLSVPDWFEEYLHTGQLPDTRKPYTQCPFTALRAVITPPDPGYIYTCTYWRADQRFAAGTLPLSQWLRSPARRQAIRRVNPCQFCNQVICNKHSAILKIDAWCEHYRATGELPPPQPAPFVPFLFF